MKKLIFLSVLILLPVVFLAADYTGLFGTEINRIYDQVSVIFEPMDSKSHAGIQQVHIICYRQGSSNACSEVDAGDRYKAGVMLTIPRLVTRSLLFELSSEQLVSDDLELQLVFIHTDYEKNLRSYRLAELIKMQASPTRIELTPTTRTLHE